MPTQERGNCCKLPVGELAPETIDQFLEAAKESIGCRRAEEVTEKQLCSIFDYLDAVSQPIASIEQELRRRVEKLCSPLPSLGISAVLAAAIHAESDPITDFASADQYVAYTGLDPLAANPAIRSTTTARSASAAPRCGKRCTWPPL